MALDVRQPDDLVAAVAVEVRDRRRRRGPLQPRVAVDVGPRPRVAVHVVVLDARAQPPDELAPAEARAGVRVLAVRVPGRREHRGPVVVEHVDEVVVVGDDDLQLRVVVELADADVLAERPVAVVADAVERGVARVVPRPSRLVATGPVEDEHLRAGLRRVRRRRDDLVTPVPVDVGGGEAARLRALAAAARRRGPAGPDLQGAAARVIGGDRPVVAAHHDLPAAVPVEVGDDARRVDPSLARRPLAQHPPARVEHEGRVGGRDDLELPVAVEVDERGGGEPARLAGRDVTHEPRRRDTRGARRLRERQRRGSEQDEEGRQPSGHAHAATHEWTCATPYIRPPAWIRARTPGTRRTRTARGARPPPGASRGPAAR